jgi:hypothetical protein
VNEDDDDEEEEEGEGGGRGGLRRPPAAEDLFKTKQWTRWTLSATRRRRGRGGSNLHHDILLFGRLPAADECV